MKTAAAACPAPLNRLTSHTERRRREPSMDQIQQAAAARVAKEASAKASQPPIELDIEIVITPPAKRVPVCRSCGVLLTVVDPHWLFTARCECCGTDRVDKLVRQIVRARTSESATRAMRALERGPLERARTEASTAAEWAALERAKAFPK
jgi:hypothetical protein